MEIVVTYKKNGNCCNIGGTRSHIHVGPYTISVCFYDPHFLSCCRFRSINTHSEPPVDEDPYDELNSDDNVIPKAFSLNAALCKWYRQERLIQATVWWTEFCPKYKYNFLSRHRVNSSTCLIWKLQKAFAKLYICWNTHPNTPLASINLDSKGHEGGQHGAHLVRDPGGPHVGPMNFAIWEYMHGLKSSKPLANICTGFICYLAYCVRRLCWIHVSH